MSNESVQVLVVDDVGTIKKILRPTLINQLGFSSNNITEAYNGKQALEKLRSEQFDLVVCEWNISEITGIEKR